MKPASEKQRHWLGKLANLNAAKTPGRGLAPHKPLMIFCVMDLIERGTLTDRWVAYNADLVTEFRNYWDLVVERRQNTPEITMPFNALGSDRDAVWERFDEHGNPSKSKLTTRLCHLDSDLFDCLLDPAFRRQARQRMILSYFTPSEQVQLSTRLKLPIPDTAEIAAFAKDRAAFKASQKKGRSSLFKVAVGTGYRYTCALTGYCMHCTKGYLVEAAHIHEHSKSGNDDPRNGLALSPDAHWMFDKGLWTALPNGDHFIIQVAQGTFTETSPHARSLQPYHGQPLHFAKNTTLRPDFHHLQWHTRNIYLEHTG
jgi:putative restriction endonuclease